MGAQVVQAYSSMGLVMDLLLYISVSLFFSPRCTCKCFVNFNGLVSFCLSVLYVFGEGEFRVK